MKTLNEIYEELRAEAGNEDCVQSLWDMAKKIFDDYCKKDWSGANNELEYQFIKNNIENNDYYEIMRKEYSKHNEVEKDSITREIRYCYKYMFDCYYSIYTIMNTIEEYLQNHKKMTISEAIHQYDFEIKEY